VGDLYNRLKAFSSWLGAARTPLYFAKVDVQAAFDTIPQAAVVRLMSKIPHQKLYAIAKHAEVKPIDQGRETGRTSYSKATRRWHALAKADDDESSFLQKVEAQLAPGKKNTVFVDNAMVKRHPTKELVDLMSTHVQQNMVKIGKKYYRQKKGIPQGSVLSSILCSYFYADLEKRYLSFLAGQECLLLRLIDDFLLITTSPAKARMFVRVMHHGLPAYGVAVNPDKTLVNFDMSVDDRQVPRISEGQAFPYCGTRINCQTLDIAKDRETVKDPGEQTQENQIRSFIFLLTRTQWYIMP
jgi:telomerase reverse transcriptase